MTIIRWEPPLYEPNQRIADVNGYGRYSVRRAYKGAHRRWIVLLNGKRIGDTFPTREACMKYVEEVHQPNLERDSSAAAREEPTVRDVAKMTTNELHGTIA